MNDETLKSPQAIKTFLSGCGKIDLQINKKDCPAFIAKILKRTDYFNLRKGEKSSVREYLLLVTGYTPQHLTKLIAEYRKYKWIGRKVSLRTTFAKQYTREDILLLAKTDEAHDTLSGGATKKLFERAHEVYKDEDYKRLANISISHIYNLRKSNTYQQKRRHFTKTNYTPVSIGERKKPQPEGRPGYIRIDTVHQGDQDKKKGVYHINATDEVTQYQVVCTVEKISENYLIPVLEALFKSFPFKIINFHSDNGSEYINSRVAKLLNKLNIELTKSRPRHSNDNALAECKNGAVVRKCLGYIHIPQQWASVINEFNQKHFTPYINFHRPCYFSEIKINEKGKQKKTYPYKLMMTPYEKFKSLPNADNYLKPGITFEELDNQAMIMTDLQAAKALKKAREALFKTIFSLP